MKTSERCVDVNDLALTASLTLLNAHDRLKVLKHCVWSRASGTKYINFVSPEHIIPETICSYLANCQPINDELRQNVQSHGADMAKCRNSS